MKPFNPESVPLKSLAWQPFIKLIGQANAALGRYDGLLEGVVNPDVLLSPLITQEAVLSSRIEGTISTLEEVFEFDAAGEDASEKTQDIWEIVNYRSAMNHAVEELKTRPISLNFFLDLHSILLDSVRGRNKGRGKFRKVQNWIGPKGCSIEEATYVPPAPEGMMELLSDLEKYLHFDDIDALVQLAIIHGQFEIIHPFVDGNGRLGRMLIPLYLYEKKLLSRPTFYLSSYLESRREEYYDKLQAISSNGDWSGWIIFFLEAIIAQALDNSAKAKSMLDLYEKMKKDIPRLTRTRNEIRVLDTLFRNPIFRTSDFITRSQIQKVSAMRILRVLQEDGVLTVLSESRGRRPAMLMFGELINLAEGKSVV